MKGKPMRFIEMIVPYAASLVGIVCLIACVRSKHDVRWFWSLFIFTAVVFLTACAWPKGKGLLVSEKYPTLAQKNTVRREFRELLFGTNAPLESVSVAKPPPKSKGTWGWWKAFAILVPFNALCACFALTEQIAEWAAERKKHKLGGESDKHETKGGDKHAVIADKSHFFKLDLWDIISMAIEAVRLIKPKV